MVNTIGFTEENRHILITGCGRSGTNYTTALLLASGIDVNHERPGSTVTIAWPMVAQTYTPFLEDDFGEPPHFDVVLHQVRNPLDVINSWLVNLPEKDRREWEFIRTHIPEIEKDDTLLIHCVKYWIYWNLKTEAIANWRYRIEDIRFITTKLEKFLQMPIKSSALVHIPQDLNKWNSIENRLTWEDLKEQLPSGLFDELKLLTRRYGYSVILDES